MSIYTYQIFHPAGGFNRISHIPVRQYTSYSIYMYVLLQKNLYMKFKFLAIVTFKLFKNSFFPTAHHV